MRHTLSSKADWSDRWITPSKLFRVQLGTGDKHTQTRPEIRSRETERLRRTSGTICNWRLTIIQGLEVSDELDVLVHGGLFGVDGPSEHVAAELELIFCWCLKEDEKR